MTERKNPLNLIKALRQAADKIESGEIKYSWGNSKQCNCGVVAQLLVQGLDRVGGSWTGMADLIFDNKDPDQQLYCPVTKLALKVVFDTLLDNGFVRDDFEHLEFLSNPEICKEANLKLPQEIVERRYYGYLSHFSNKDNLIKYLRAWANLLCQEQCALKETNA